MAKPKLGFMGLALLTLVLASGCGQDLNSDASLPIGQEEEVQASPPPLSNAGWGEISGETPFEGDRIQGKLPQYRVETGVISQEGESYPVIDVFDGETQVAQLDPKNPNRPQAGILRITIVDPSIPGPEGVRVGMAWGDSPNREQFNCFSGEGPTTGYQICSPPNGPQLQYLYPMTGGAVGDRTPLDRLIWLNF
ncbi:DUF1131 family protein [Phormidium yuhuli AB48]|uniref:DUF1131 family protein n=1 Tax=Phormidium yuhuli AB48 TaxID=2940671 RepID=A0ABY5AMQ8_9CYAN|nr:DUF1131 family protein [Phormidium yuhuli]USR90218.1 DUF1131 family protein [Phormidium yuhuli AB48]